MVPKGGPQPTLAYTPIDDISKIRERVKAGFNSGKLRSIEYRKNQLLQLAYLLKENSKRFEDAFGVDLGRHSVETNMSEFTTTIAEAVEAYKSVDKWSKPEGAPFDIQWFPLRPKVYKSPKGVVLIIGPFNYPLAGAIAAGCACVLKMSELTPSVSGLVTELFPKYMDQDLFQIVNGGIPETSKILELQWDHIVFTGSATVGKIVAAAAAKHLTPVTLELGGQNPVFLDPSYDLDVAARRLLWGRYMNVGQVCLSPNHIFIPASAQDKLIDALSKAYDSFYPEGPAKSESVSRLVTTVAFDRLKGVLEKTQGTIVRGGLAEADRESRFFPPTIVKDVKVGDSLLEAELFGPILPIVPVKDLQEGIDYTNARPHPLAAYVFTDDAKLKKYVIEHTQSGAIDVNDVCVHLAIPGLPFGGVGNSGYGAHTGKFSFDTFTHHRSSLDSPGWVDKVFSFRFPPYTEKKLKQALLISPKIPAPRPGPGIGPAKKTGLLVSTRSVVVALGVLMFALGLRRALGYDGWFPPALVDLASRFGVSGRS
ncbi:hypothetical protein M407DRAFT_21961 [Tulasnella calospora MUT 4182]|uniref:Aldehyde dehydrogenase n=1 Tax=Tulasnella calospora MUT 4182 TaxID=1051891 RepID=A0A0C3QNW8_9AGAM|nr:hypothetical protein M407DRAFT_21961 [Tulasnella calospora MUT 4182]